MKFYKERTERIEEMKKKIIIISSIIVCLLIVGGITFIAHNKTSEDKTSDVTESLEAETSTDADKESDVSTDKEKDDTSTNKKETNTVESDKKEEEHKHTWVTGYRTEEKVVHHDAVTHTETQTTYTTETTTVHHDGHYVCYGCGATFTSADTAAAHCDAGDDVCFGSGFGGTPGYDEQVSTQVPHTETVTVTDQAAWDETVVEKIEYTYCSECGVQK